MRDLRRLVRRAGQGIEPGEGAPSFRPVDVAPGRVRPPGSGAQPAALARATRLQRGSLHGCAVSAMMHT